MTASSRLCELRHHVGRRGAALLILGIFDFVYGWTKMIHPDPISANSQQMQLLAELVPLDGPRTSMVVWGMAWWITGAFCVFNAFRTNDRWGYGMAMGVKISWIGGNAWAWTQGLVGGGSIVATWTFTFALVCLLAYWPEPVVDLERLALDHEPDRAVVVEVDQDGRSRGDDDPNLIIRKDPHDEP